MDQIPFLWWIPSTVLQSIDDLRETHKGFPVGNPDIFFQSDKGSGGFWKLSLTKYDVHDKLKMYIGNEEVHVKEQAFTPGPG